MKVTFLGYGYFTNNDTLVCHTTFTFNLAIKRSKRSLIYLVETFFFQFLSNFLMLLTH